MIDIKAPSKQLSIGQLFGKLFQLRDEANLRHLYPTNPGKLGSGWEHTTLNSFYEDLLELLDTLIESYQGKYGLIDIILPSTKKPDIKECLKENAKLLENYDFGTCWLDNQRDEIITLIYSTLYKLNNLT